MNLRQASVTYNVVIGILLFFPFILAACGGQETPTTTPTWFAPTPSPAGISTIKPFQPTVPTTVAFATTAATTGATPTNLIINRENTATAGVSRVKAGNNTIEVCNLLTQEEVTALFGEPVQPPYFTTSLSSCDYYAQNNASRKNLEITLLANQPNWVKFRAENTGSTTFLPFDSGIGSLKEDSFALGQLIGPVLYFHKQNLILSVSLTGLNLDLVEEEKKLAQLIYPRLP